MSLFMKTAERLHEYMVANKVEIYSPEVGNRFVQMEQSSSEVGPTVLKTDRRAIEVLHMILAGEPIVIKKQTSVKHYPGEIGDAAEKFLKYRESELRYTQGSINRYANVLSPFSIYCNMQGITLQNIDYGGIVGYMGSSQNTDSRTASVLRIFFKYLYDKELLQKDYSLEIVDIKPRRREKIPSFYSKEEILKIENSIERTYPLGKRDFAMVRLASRLGLRASDIAGLEFTNIDWERDVIKLEQKKTGKVIELPLLAEVGNALIDYIQNGRPQDGQKRIFLSQSCPHHPMKSGAISYTVSKYISKAGIDVNGRRHGAHCLRHSLAYAMLESGSKLDTISSALGHSSVNSTMCYLGIDISGLMECSLPVPAVAPSFYNQGGGLLYD